jgi:hypothetical protein
MRMDASPEPDLGTPIPELAIVFIASHEYSTGAIARFCLLV